MTSNHASTADPARPLQPGSPELTGLRVAMFLCGLSSVAILHVTQPLLPELSLYFTVSPAAASWTLSATMLGLALALLPAGLLSDRYGRRVLLWGGLGLASLATLAAAWAPQFRDLLLWRTLTGLMLAGVPAIALAYLSEEVAPSIVGRTIALYAAGNALGGVSGRLVAGALGDFASWRLALAAIGGFGLLTTLILFCLLPRERQFKPTQHRLADTLGVVAAHCRNPELRRYFYMGFILMGVFISLYSFISYRLLESPFNLGTATTSLLFLLLLTGMPISMLTGNLIDHRGPWLPIGGGALLMLAGLLGLLTTNLWWMTAALVVFTIGYFFSYTATNSSVTRRAPFARATAAALYLCCFYSGGALMNALTGFAWETFHWPGVIGLHSLCMLVFICLWQSMPRWKTPLD